MNLAAMQAALAKMLREGQSLVGQRGPEDVAPRIAQGNERLSPIEQIDIYREQFFLRHVDSLRKDFLAVEHAVGHERFEEICKAYLTKHPPASFTLRDVGHAFASFIADDPFLVDLARVEWAFIEAFDAADVPPLDPASIATATEDQWPGAKLSLHPSVQRLALMYPAHDYRQAVREEEDAERPEPRDSFVVVYRAPDALRFADLERDAFRMLDEIAAGQTLADACENAARAASVDLEVFQSKLAGWFQHWTSCGWVSGIHFLPSGRAFAAT